VTSALDGGEWLLLLHSFLIRANYLSKSRVAHSVQRVATGWTIGCSGLESQWELRIFLFDTMSRPVVGPIQLPIQLVPGTLSLEVKRPMREADHSPLSSVDVKEYVDLHLHSQNTPSWRGAVEKSTGTTLSLL
jgi:hypothetical protein